MFPSSREIARRFLTNSQASTNSENPETIAAEQQLLRELEVAADEGMRADEERGVREIALVRGMEGKMGRKRNNLGDEGVEEVEAQSAKRRKMDNEKRHCGVENRDIRSPGLRKGMRRNAAGQNDVIPLISADTPAIISATVQVVPDGMHTSTTSAPVSNRQAFSVSNYTGSAGIENMGKANDLDYGNSETQNPTNPGKKRKIIKNSIGDLDAGELSAASNAIVLSGSFVPKVSELKNPVHKRFGSEEPETQAKISYNGIEDHHIDRELEQESHAENEDNSDDDVPEVVTASAGLDRARNAAAEALKAVDRQALAKKEKRRARDAHLKEQRHAHSTKFPDRLHNNATPETSLPRAKSKKAFKRTDPLPDFLPDEILAAAPEIRLPILQPIITTINQKKRKFINAEPKPPKDIKWGFVRVRVLEDSNPALPPRASKSSKSLRESWLVGQRGRNDVASRRRMVGGGFVKK